MKMISFNINGIRARLHQLQAIIDKHQPDIIGLQEIKVHNEQFPEQAVREMGYEVYYHGQKSHYGVAFLSKIKPDAVQYGFPSDTDDAQRRMIMMRFEQNRDKPLTVLNGYFPQGENRDHETKFPAKRKFYQDLMQYLGDHHTPEDDVVIMGDLNISPTDADIGIGEQNAKRWLRTGKCSFLPEEREWIKHLYDWGLTDSFRAANPTTDDQFSWFDYRSKGFLDNRGLRIDHILATRDMHAKLEQTGIDYELRGIEKPSDHAPIWAVYKR
ncbi:exodeoxyribonuclease III [Salinimonas marina]|uniref:Exodeoxyribonuclease III n=1 Tax=Salinimonas marina TaxID=2785918 RepID=A0A7S9HC66_9ALTE|nr:exodeoxyribonuclease III [Salinimonas marina]QPG04537.1 exodeoxyribonuclease III [Salinimonas marina]